ncbi:hypothetical protein [Nocardia sp. XZ_19_385]|uniref:hypothetical protein n=1 Tax=Nocardia sp. XZ_19_385 TaxID=2769488 RepID=UPI00188EBDD2|nr:hypothetical protein [Nocardia sp. XZ_19_385]
MSLNGFGSTLVVTMPPPLPKVNFLGSRVAEVLVGGTDFVELRIRGFTAEATHPMFGKITLGQPDVDVSPNSILALSPSGLGLIETWRQSMNVTFERCGDCPGPFRFSTLEPAEWTAELSEFPPAPQRAKPDGAPTGGALYRMTRPIRLGARADARSAAHSVAQPGSDPCRCALGTPLPSSNSLTGTEYVRIENLHFNQGQLTA